MCRGCYNCRESFNAELGGQKSDDVTKISKSALRSRRAGPAAAVRGRRPEQRRRSSVAEHEAVAWKPGEEEPEEALGSSDNVQSSFPQSKKVGASAPDTNSVRWRKALNAKED